MTVLVTLSAASGAPGVSAWALALAIALPGRRPRVLLEADLAGGVLAGRYGLGPEPGAASLLGSIRARPHIGPDLATHGRRLGSGSWCVPGPPVAATARRLWREGADTAAVSLAEDNALWLVDCGRAEPRATLGPVFGRAIAHIVVSSASPVALIKARDHARRLPGAARTGLLVVNPRLPDPDRLPRMGAHGAVWVVVRPPGLAALATRSLGSRRTRWSRSWRAVEQVAAAVGRWLLVPPPSPTGPVRT